ncbi:MAG: DUF4254 domain-containing protein [bacterium]
MEINYQNISKVYLNYLSETSKEFDTENKIDRLLLDCIADNKHLWKLEDVARMQHLGFESVAKAKLEIDVVNQRRNETINKLDSLLDKHLCNAQLESPSKFYSESPGMLLDRLAILFIKQNFIRQLIGKIDEKNLKSEYLEKEQLLNQNITDLGLFTDLYFDKIRKGETYFKIYQPLKIYNDHRIKNALRLLMKNDMVVIPYK